MNNSDFINKEIESLKDEVRCIKNKIKKIETYLFFESSESSIIDDDVKDVLDIIKSSTNEVTKTFLSRHKTTRKFKSSKMNQMLDILIKHGLIKLSVSDFYGGRPKSIYSFVKQDNQERNKK